MSTLRESRFFDPLTTEYAHAVPMAICRVPELELLSRVPLVRPVLDHCCGDGVIAAMAFPGVKIDAGTDISKEALAKAERRGNYGRVVWGDAGNRLPFNDGEFATLFNNSALEHIPDVHVAVAEMARVLKPGGVAYVNILNTRFFDRWPLSSETRDDYRQFQPFYHAHDEAGWTKIFTDAGFEAPTFTPYFAEHASRVFAELDYKYSAFYIKRRLSLRLLLDRLTPRRFLAPRWRRRYGALRWDARDGDGSAFQIAARKRA